jgi:hypothetical protein
VHWWVDTVPYVASSGVRALGPAEPITRVTVNKPPTLLASTRPPDASQHGVLPFFADFLRLADVVCHTGRPCRFNMH